MNEITDDMEAGPEDKTEDEDETEDNPDVKYVEMAKSFNDYGFGGPRKGSPIGKDDWGTPRSSDWGRPCSPTHYTWAPKISRPSSADTPRLATSFNTEYAENKTEISPIQEDVPPIRTV